MRIPRSSSFLLAILLLFSAERDTSAQWTKMANGLMGPLYGYGGMCYKSGLLWVGNKNLFVSADSGSTWRSGGITNLAYDHIVTSIAFYDNMTGLVGGWSGDIFLTLDQGANWKEIHKNILIPTVCFMGSVNDIVVAADSIYVSRDQGLTWHSSYLGGWIANVTSPSPGRIEALAQNVLSKAGTVYSSSDYGFTWSASSGNINGDSFSLAVDSCDNKQIYVANENAFQVDDKLSRMYYSPDNGTTWNIGAVFPSPFFSGSVALSNNAIFCATASHGIWRSTDHGISWSSIGGPSEWYDSRNIAVVSDNILFAADSDGSIWRTFNSGGNTLPNPFSLSNHLLFAGDSLDDCNASLNRFVKVISFGCNILSIIDIHISGKDSSSYALIPLDGDSVGVSFKPRSLGLQNGVAVIALSNGSMDTISLQGTGIGITPHHLSLVTSDQSTDTIGGSVSVPITINGLDHKEDVDLVLHYGSELRYHGSYSTFNVPLDIPGQEWAGRSKLHISQATPDTILGFATFDVFHDSSKKTEVLFDSVSVLTSVIPCQYVLPESAISTITPPSGCGIVTLSRFIHEGIAPQLSLSPNPTSGEIRVTSSADLGKVNIEIFDMLGIQRGMSAMAIGKNVPTKLMLPVRNGVYSLRIRSAERSYDLRVIVNK